MTNISIDSLKDNFIESIGKEWMLVTAGAIGKFNTMTASWGGIGFLWNKPVVFVFVRPERYTYEFIEENEFFTLSFLGEEGKEIHKVCGSKSGRTTDKVAATGLRPVATPCGSVAFENSRLTLECRKLYGEDMKPSAFLAPETIEKWYNDRPGGSIHKMYIAEIVNVFEK